MQEVFLYWVGGILILQLYVQEVFLHVDGGHFDPTLYVQECSSTSRGHFDPEFVNSNAKGIIRHQNH